MSSASDAQAGAPRPPPDVPVAGAVPAGEAQLPALDGLRGFAALMVVTHNLLLLRDPTSAASHLLVSVLDRGWIGVQLFFVLSGFLITGILLDGRGLGLANFFARRVLRIFPLYYATLVVVFLLLPALNALPAGFHRDPPDEVWYWTYLSNWVTPFRAGAGPFPHFWSLAVEEQFYLLWPFLVGRRSPRSVFALCLAVAAIGPVSRTLLLASDWPDGTAYQFTISRIDALALGGAAAALLRDARWRARVLARRRGVLLAAAAVGVLGALPTHGYRVLGVLPQTLGYAALALMFALAVLGIAGCEACGDRGRMRWLRWPALRWVGTYSYGLYVLHVPLHMLIGLPLLARMGYTSPYPLPVAIAYIATGTLVSIVAAVVVFHGLEAPFLRLKQRFPRAPGGPGGTTRQPCA